jgi:hypothetical protein
MTLEKLSASLKSNSPPDLPPLLLALWYDAKGNWDQAHRITQDIDGSDAAWVHAYLHRKEGDLSNARYCYHRAQKSESTSALETEWEQIVRSLL